jgi:hypothetical protein
MTIDGKKFPSRDLEGMPNQKHRGKKEGSLAESVVAEVRKGLEEIEARSDDKYYYYPFPYHLIFDLEEYLERLETRDGALQLAQEKRNLFMKINERIQKEVDDKLIPRSGENARVMDALVNIIEAKKEDKH